MRALLRAVALTGLLTACGGGDGGTPVSTPAPAPTPTPAPSPTPTPGPPPPVGTAALTVTIAGVTADAALVRVDGPAGLPPRFLSTAATLDNLPAGSYTITPTDALTGSTLQRAPAQTLTLGEGDTRSAVVNYISASDFSLRLQEVVGTAAGLSAPIDLQAPPGDARLFIAERPGRIRIVQNGTLLSTPFLDIAGRVATEGEGGLLSFAFHPQFGAANPFVYVMYTANPGASGADIVVERFQLSAGNPNQLQNTGVQVLRVAHPTFTNHYGGRVAFGPDGMLYVSIGDGGGGGDPNGNAQDAASLLGKVLRLDVSALPYSVPADNPSWASGARRENWAIGLRNPWRYAFDAPTGLLYIADVGQDQREEINIVPATSAGRNYGWNVTEGTRCYAASSCSTTGFTLPAVEYDHGEGCSITGGYVYRGTALPELQGRYFYSDFCEGFLRSLRYDGGVVVERVQWIPPGVGNIQSFGQDGAGNLYLLLRTGRVLRVERG